MLPLSPSDHDLLIEIHTVVKALDRTVNGNGRPGLIEEVAALKSSLPSTKEKRTERAAIVVSLISALGLVASTILG